MLENLYTTKMSSDKKTLQNRFAKIRSKNVFSKTVLFIMTAVITTAMLCAGIATAAIGVPPENAVEILYDGTVRQLKNQPFIYESEVYVPLREIMNICGVDDSNISYDNGNIKISFTDSRYGIIEAYIAINQNGVAFNKDSEYRIMSIDGARTTTHPALIVNDSTYIPCGMLIRIKNYYIAEDFDDRIYTDLLGNIEIRKYNADGKYDAVVCAPVNIDTADKYNPQSYYAKDERAVIGTASDFDSKEFGHTEINGYYYPTDAAKHILIDDDGRVLAVIPYENFRHERIDPAPFGTSTFKNVMKYTEDSLAVKRGGGDVFANGIRTLPDGKEYSFARLYCFIDFRYVVK